MTDCKTHASKQHDESERYGMCNCI